MPTDAPDTSLKECGICRRKIDAPRMFDSTVLMCWRCHLKQFKRRTERAS